jgi:hypothetical protein
MSDGKHTPGPWIVVTTEHPYHLGGKHIERRIFTAWDHPQMKGPIGVVNGSVGLGPVKGGPCTHMVSLSEEDARLIAAAPELLAACKVAFDQTCSVGRPKDWEQLRAAIARATGRQGA